MCLVLLHILYLLDTKYKMTTIDFLKRYCVFIKNIILRQLYYLTYAKYESTCRMEKKEVRYTFCIYNFIGFSLEEGI